MIWKEKYRIGIPSIDEQHEELFARISGFVESVRSYEDTAVKEEHIRKTLSFMEDYVVIHFQDEETYQNELGYPDRENHKKIHDEMVAYMETIIKEYEKNGYREIVMQQLAGKFVTWLVNHVLVEDMKLAAYVNKGE